MGAYHGISQRKLEPLFLRTPLMSIWNTIMAHTVAIAKRHPFLFIYSINKIKSASNETLYCYLIIYLEEICNL